MSTTRWTILVAIALGACGNEGGVESGGTSSIGGKADVFDPACQELTSAFRSCIDAEPEWAECEQTFDQGLAAAEIAQGCHLPLTCDELEENALLCREYAENDAASAECDVDFERLRGKSGLGPECILRGVEALCQDCRAEYDRCERWEPTCRILFQDCVVDFGLFPFEDGCIVQSMADCRECSDVYDRCTGEDCPETYVACLTEYGLEDCSFENLDEICESCVEDAYHESNEDNYLSLLSECVSEHGLDEETCPISD